MYTITESIKNNKMYYYNPITKRDILKNPRNYKSIVNQIKKYEDKQTIPTTQEVQPPHDVQLVEGEAVHNPADDVAPEIKEIFTDYTPNKRTLNNYIDKVHYVFTTAQDIRYEILNNVDTANQSQFIERLNFMTHTLKDTRKVLIKLINNNNMDKDDSRALTDNYLKYCEIRRKLIDEVLKLNQYANKEAEDTANKNRLRAEILQRERVARGRACKKLNNLVSDQMTKWIKYKMENESTRCKYGQTLTISPQSIADLKIDYNYIKSQCKTPLEIEIFELNYADKMNE